VADAAAPAAQAQRPAFARVMPWLTGTRLGRAVLSALVLKAAVQVLRPLVGALTFIDTLDVAASLVLVGVVTVVAFRWLGYLRRVVLWRVRRRLLLSYLLVGAVPAFLLVAFFAIAGLLLFINAGAYMFRGQLAAMVERLRTETEAATLALEIVSADRDPAAHAGSTRAEAERLLARRVAAVSSALPGLTFSVLENDTRCGRAPNPRDAWSGLVVGVSGVGGAPRELPGWVPCAGHAGLVNLVDANGARGEALRAVVWLPGQARALVASLPVQGDVLRLLSESTGVSLATVTRVDDPDAAETAGPRIRIGPLQVPLEERQTLGAVTLPRWASFLDSADWATGARRTLFVEFGVDFPRVYRQLVATPTPPRAELTFGQVLLLSLAVLAGLFFVIQLAAYVMGFALARSITGAVHALSEGTERVRQGDFSHAIAVPSHDQLGALAASFNSMTASIDDLLRQKARKDLLERELAIARDIQMSLLPQEPLDGGGVVFSGHCEPARAVGGDYYDFWRIDEHRYGVLMADVAGKGTFAALYMAELKGIVHSLSPAHSSPRQLLVNANRIVSHHLSVRSFITMTYGVVDLRSRKLTFARAGHCPLIRLPGPEAASREPEVLAPDGMVLGLRMDEGQLFEGLLVECTRPLGAGDVFLLYTDGVTETMNAAGDFFGESRLCALAREFADRPFSELRDHLMTAVMDFSGSSEQQDDMTFLVVKVRQLPAAA
jgi:serine phosphatase RsbU (regulator of sigma subunit)